MKPEVPDSLEAPAKVTSSQTVKALASSNGPTPEEVEAEYKKYEEDQEA